MEKKDEFVTKQEMLTKIRAAIEDRAAWFAFLYDEFTKLLPEEKVIEASRRAIHKFGTLKAKNDPEPFHAKDWVLRHKEKGSAAVFDSDIDFSKTRATQKMNYCPLVESWSKLGYSPDKIDLFCDIAMDGDRGRADSHDGIQMKLHETIGKGCKFCRLEIIEE
ncbi:L-2-amino-thiazoline-4-carboxylic acid hydrolase [Sediminispirochaeta smaragdinae]|jgi:hypothetical protein|uniref:L-2-amino-thiazoline-4-carboxylic acid hydrolase n=1 Tax=Sediminispirochaeta smaragdinae (strain DSM 11293 / JCM 15392 / SEBR 4228) TaxID=573413 RepID=E1R8R9_SEDSS|nr:L-2-amino-thiazoline-4-carboxylic acid hydrolase [Sediminispirochaeta smaragdinae]ADK81826.1 conserved hypothetical protein [Sediminispirochaeta smaragdinae DSM 11293]